MHAGGSFDTKSRRMYKVRIETASGILMA